MQKAKELGLDYLVTGSLTKANVMFYNNAYYGDFKFTLKVFNVETGMFFNTKSFSAGSIAVDHSPADWDTEGSTSSRP